VTTNLGYPGVAGDAATWGCHSIAEVLALELGSLDDYVMTKAQVWMSLSKQKEIATELRRSAHAFVRGLDLAIS
jgi:S-adenosylmethionine:diacylglycerol 3-amino-3-carboxypropyl transferase